MSLPRYPSYRDSGVEWLGEVPEHWEVKRLKQACHVFPSNVDKKSHDGEEPVLLCNYTDVYYNETITQEMNFMAATASADQIAKFTLRAGDTIITKDSETADDIAIAAHVPHDLPVGDLERYALKHGDVLMNEGGDFDKLGRGCIWESQIEPCITQNHVFAVRPRSVSSAWLNAITSSDFAQFYFMTRSKQSTNLASISSTNLMELPVLLPPASEQRNILAFVAAQTDSFDTLTTEAQHAIDLLQERRTALISAAVTGQIDVRGAVAA